MAWKDWELEFIEKNIQLKPEDMAKVLGKKVSLVVNKIANTRYLYEKRCKYEAKVVKRYHKKKDYKEIDLILGRSKEHVVQIMKNIGVWKYKCSSESQKYNSDLIFKGKERFNELSEVKLGVKCSVEYKSSGPKVDKGKFVEVYEDFYIFQHEKNGCREAFLKSDLVTGEKRVKYL